MEHFIVYYISSDNINQCAIIFLIYDRSVNCTHKYPECRENTHEQTWRDVRLQQRYQPAVQEVSSSISCVRWCKMAL